MKVITFGEIMARFSPEGYKRFLQADHFEINYGGAEANVAVALSSFGIETEFVTKLPDNEIAQAAINKLRSFDVGTKYIVRGGRRMGTYFLEKGFDARPSKVIYDRENSAISQAEIGEFDWDKIFEGADWFHFTGITAALSDTCAKMCYNAVRNAKEKGIIVSCDTNYRKKLWSIEKANEVMSKLMPYVDVCINPLGMFGFIVEDKISVTDINSTEKLKKINSELIQKFKFKKTAYLLRDNVNSNGNKLSAVYFDGKDYYYTKEQEVNIIDRVGGGDSFGAGLIYSMLNMFGPQKAIEFAVAASCLKHTIAGDFNMTTVDEVNKLANGDSSGRVQR